MSLGASGSLHWTLISDGKEDPALARALHVGEVVLLATDGGSGSGSGSGSADGKDKDSKDNTAAAASGPSRCRLTLFGGVISTAKGKDCDCNTLVAIDFQLPASS